ncbi:MAG: enoyl-CoA hydratase/isomerase family protein [Chloroflexi bacterium]|nr:enoyl-CoA hydratase/isomerase family protein [Chloroflexota bacterium]MCI0770189.1 enoyl-CoA hydratase/isomerase family protein [Chloroflexota bacterium]
MSEPAVLYEKKDGIATVTINRPESLNAMDAEVMEGLTKAWIDVRDDPAVIVAIVTGAGEKSFSSGGNLKTYIPQATEGTYRAKWDTVVPGMLRGFDLYKPVIAAVNGYCIAGGMELLCGTDIRIAAEHATFAVAEVRWGLFPGGGTTVRLPRQIPYCMAMELLLVGGNGGRVTAQEALNAGLVNKVVPLADLMPVAMDYAHRLKANGPLSLQAIKRSVLMTQGVPTELAYHIESQHSRVCFESDDAKEGLKAFAEKRSANFKGR